MTIGTEETSVETKPVTSENIISTGKKVADNLQAIELKFPETASSLLTYTRIYEGETPNDPDVLVIKEVVGGYKSGNEKGADNRADGVVANEIPGVNTERFMRGLENLDQITSDGSADALFFIVTKEKDHVIKEALKGQLIGEPIRMAAKHPDDYPEARYMLTAYKSFELASAELIPHLKRKPSDIMGNKIERRMPK